MVIICCKPYFVFGQDGYARISLCDYSNENFGVPAASSVGEDGKKVTDHSARITHLTNLAI